MKTSEEIYINADVNRHVLTVLNNIKLCAENKNLVIENFKYSPMCGICWHLKNNTDMNEFHISVEFLNCIFVEMGLHFRYPVEMQLPYNENIKQAAMTYSVMSDQYNSLETGHIRMKLLNDLIEKFESYLQ